jgi:DNA-binding SARP family transcriptional activator
VRIAVLGTMDVRIDGEDRTPSAPKVRSALAVLLMQANHVVPVARLIEELWDEEPPRLARKTVQTYMYQLRQRLALPAAYARPPVLETHPSGYTLRLEPPEMDLWVFQAAVALARREYERGDHVRVAALLREALSLWRGEVLCDVDAGTMLAARIARIDEVRIEALELLYEAELILGRHREVLGELTELTAQYPLHEEFTAQLMTAAHRAAQRGTALEAFSRLRTRLIDQLGLEPSPRLHQLQHDVLNRASSWPPPAEPVSVAPRRIAHLPPDIEDFAGRTRELQQLKELGQPAPAATAPRLVVLLGMAGSGKTTLAVHAAHALKESFPDGQLYAVLRDSDGTPLDPADVLRAILRDTGTPLDHVPPGTESLVRAYRSWAADRSLLIVLDDAAGAEQLLPLLPGSGTSTVLVTSRVRIPGMPGGHTVELGPMDPADAADLFASSSGADPARCDPQAVRAVVRYCDHLPLAVRAAGELLAARRLWTASDLARRLADEQTRLAELGIGESGPRTRLTRALDRLDPVGGAVMRRLAACGPGGLDLPSVAAQLDVDVPAAEAVVGALLDQHMLYTIGGSGRAASFRMPDLLRLAAVSAA